VSVDDGRRPDPDRPAGPRDDRLHAARRIDWRFLLGSPALGRVRVVGTPDPWLQRGLDEAADAVLIGSPTDRDDPLADTAVITGHASTDALREAVSSVGPDGRLVVEVDLVGSTGLVIPGTAVRSARALRADGWTSVTTWWTWPVRSRPSLWARADDPVGLRALGRRLGQPRDAIVGTTAALLGRFGAGRSLLASAAPAITIVAERAEGTTSFVERRLGDCAGVLLVTPRFRASGHVIGIGLDREGRADRVVKISRLSDDVTLAHEADVLRALEGVAPDSGPRVIDAGRDGWTSVVETGLAGRPLDPDAVREDRPGAVRAVVDWLSTLPVQPASARQMPVRQRIESALDAILAFDQAAPGTTELGAMAERTRAYLDKLDAAELPRVFEHGDAAHPNLIVRDDGRIVAVDWERGEPDGLPLNDVTTALAYIAASEVRAGTPAEQASAFASVATGEGWAAAVLDAEAARAGVDPQLRPALVAVAWMRSVSWYADALGGRDAAPEAVPWLASERLARHWAEALRIADRSSS
jgi:aminoglycoside phosphotransferase (APT) family kinase protein